MKIKVIQIAMGGGEDDAYAEYLDDKGRVWYQGGHWEEGTNPHRTDGRTWVTEWMQVELPEEPTDEQ